MCRQGARTDMRTGKMESSPFLDLPGMPAPRSLGPGFGEGFGEGFEG